MISPRWRKVLRDLWSNKTRTLLVVLSIAVGVAAIGMVAGTYTIITQNLPSSYTAVNPAAASLLCAPFDDELVRVIRTIPGVADAEARHVLTVRLQIAPEEWRNLQLTVIPDFNQLRINKIFPEAGAWPPLERELLIERTSLGLTNAQVGDLVLVESPEGKQRELKIVGLVHDLNLPAGSFTNQANGYITLSTLQWLGYARSYNEVLITVQSQALSRESIRPVVSLVEEKIEKSGRPVYSSTIPDPGKHWFESYLQPMASILGVIGAVILLLSGFLVVNTITALLAQQARQIGIMKAIGARSGQILWMYLASMLVVGLLAFGLAVPLGWLGTRISVRLLAGYINFDITNIALMPEILQLQAALSLLLPLGAALFPITASAQVTVRDAISDYGIGKASFGSGLIDRLISRIRGLSRPLLLSLRNTFRRKLRLGLTLVTLTLGSAIFIAVSSVQASLVRTLDESLQYYNFDIAVFFNRAYRSEQILSEVRRVEGVTGAETWGMTNSRLWFPDGSESKNIMLVAPPGSTTMINPQLIAGRWLEPADEDVVVINSDVLKEDPSLAVGDQIVLKVEGQKFTWRVVGIVRSVMSGPFAYTNYPYFARVFGKYGQAGAVYISLAEHEPQAQKSMAKTLEEHFAQVGLRVNSIEQVAQLRRLVISQFNVIIAFLLVMSAMLTVVGGLGLMGTMSLNVIERTREIGVMRAIGASNAAILQIVIVEGVLIGLMSWLSGAALALPLSRVLSNAVGQGFLQTSLIHTFSYTGSVLWLGIVILLAVFASALPARSASRLTVRDVLAYE